MIKVYYESMCPDSKYFVVHQLLPTIKQLPDIADFKLVPYGKANVCYDIHNTSSMTK